MSKIHLHVPVDCDGHIQSVGLERSIKELSELGEVEIHLHIPSNGRFNTYGSYWEYFTAAFQNGETSPSRPEIQEHLEPVA